MEKICTSGIYQIKNKINGKIYIGSSINVERRFKEHKKLLSHNKHPNKHLQLSWKKYGESNFTFILLEEVLVESLLTKEQYYIDSYQSYNNDIGYNICKTAGNTLGYLFSEESKIKMSKSQQGIKKDSISKYIGVYQDQNSWFCEIAHNRIKYKKSFKNELKCALAYDKMAIFFYGKDAKLNFPQRINKYNNQMITV